MCMCGGMWFSFILGGLYFLRAGIKLKLWLLRSWRTCLILSSFRFTTLSKRPRSRAAQNVDSYILSWVALFLCFCYYPGYIWSWTTVLAGNSSFTSVELGASPKGGRGAQQIEIGELKKAWWIQKKKTEVTTKVTHKTCADVLAVFVYQNWIMRVHLARQISDNDYVLRYTYACTKIYMICCALLQYFRRQGSYLSWTHLARSDKCALSISFLQPFQNSTEAMQGMCFCFLLVHLNVSAYNCPKVLHVRASPGFGVLAQLEHYFQAASFPLLRTVVSSYAVTFDGSTWTKMWPHVPNVILISHGKFDETTARSLEKWMGFLTSR